MKKKNNFNPHIDFYLLCAFSLILLVLVLFAFYIQGNPEWKQYQKTFKRYLKDNVSTESASSFRIMTRQLWMPELNRVDRCISCHAGYDNPLLDSAPQPFTSHPDIAPHKYSEMGCTVCHGGQGYALKKKDAHGEIKHWEEPLLGKKKAEAYGIAQNNALMQINCNICHRRDKEIEGMDMINMAKRLLTEKKKCTTCHIIDGSGGKVSSDLTFIGEKPAERFDFSQIENRILDEGRPLTMLSWHIEHFLDPQSVVADSKMPKIGYTREEATALAMLMMSWREINLPLQLIPRGKKEELSVESQSRLPDLPLEEWGKELFEAKGCADCHTIGQGIEAGPDLINVAKRRSEEWIIRMIRDPETMEQEDPEAKKLYLEFEEMGMPQETVSEEEAKAIIAYIKSVK